ncbi:MAG TPA: hypothetical protein VF120_14790 [Ktedonobacterales bacterium]
MARVLVVDTDPDIRESLSVLLTLDGYTVLEASTAEQARDILRTCPDCVVVLFDSGSPAASAEAVATVVGAIAAPAAGTGGNYARRHAFVCLTTSGANLHERLRDRLGMESIPVLQKPFDLDALLAAVADAATVVDARNRVLAREP